MSVSKKKRTHKVSAGERRSSVGPELTEVQKALLGGGRVQAVTHVPTKSNWRGAREPAIPADPKQATLNRSLYPHLFMED